MVEVYGEELFGNSACHLGSMRPPFSAIWSMS